MAWCYLFNFKLKPLLVAHRKEIDFWVLALYLWPCYCWSVTEVLLQFLWPGEKLFLDQLWTFLFLFEFWRKLFIFSGYIILHFFLQTLKYFTELSCSHGYWQEVSFDISSSFLIISLPVYSLMMTLPTAFFISITVSFLAFPFAFFLISFSTCTIPLLLLVVCFPF